MRILADAGSEPGRFDTVMANEDHGPIHEMLSRHQVGPAAWIPLDPKSTVLDLDPRSGVFTEFFLQNGHHVTARCSPTDADFIAARTRPLRHVASGLKVNARRSALELPEPPPGGWDLIWLDGIPDDIQAAPDAVAQLQSLLHLGFNALSTTGLLAWGVQNRFALSMWCGVRNTGEDLPFSGLQPRAPGRLQLSRADIDALLDPLEIPHRQLWTVVPDRWSPTALIPVGHQASKEVWWRAPGQRSVDSTQVADPRVLLNQIQRNGVADFFAERFMATLRPSAPPHAVEHVTTSCDRTPEHCVVTALRSDGTVRKSAAYPCGFATLKRLVDNLDWMRSRGLNVVPAQVSQGAVIMSRVDASPLSEALLDPTRWTRTSLFEVFDLIAADIMRLTNDWRSRPAWSPNVGTDRGLVDMVPFNCFLQNGALTWFDQEFVERDCHTGYIMHRALFHTYALNPDLNEVVPRDVMATRYSVLEHWEDDQRHERDFLKSHRPSAVHASRPARSAPLDPQVIRRHRQRFLGSDAR